MSFCTHRLASSESKTLSVGLTFAVPCAALFVEAVDIQAVHFAVPIVIDGILAVGLVTRVDLADGGGYVAHAAT
jgi:hypothetical protein